MAFFKYRIRFIHILPFITAYAADLDKNSYKRTNTLKKSRNGIIFSALTNR